MDARVKLPNYFTDHLTIMYGVDESRAMAYQVMEFVSGQSLARLLADGEITWTTAEWDKIEAILLRLQTGEPLQYVLGQTEFMDLEIHVEQGVLIPRGETEELVLWAAEIIQEKILDGRKTESLKVIDLACGSGIIGIALAKMFPGLQVWSADLYETPRRLTAANALLNGVKLEVFELDVLNPKDLWPSPAFDIIISNPPYVTPSQKKEMLDKVLEFEPHEALFVEEDDPFVFYQAISELTKRILHPSGDVFFEINDALGPKLLELLKNYFPSVELRQDIHGKDRMIHAHYGKE